MTRFLKLDTLDSELRKLRRTVIQHLHRRVPIPPEVLKEKDPSRGYELMQIRALEESEKERSTKQLSESAPPAGFSKRKTQPHRPLRYEDDAETSLVDESSPGVLLLLLLVLLGLLIATDFLEIMGWG